MSRRGIRLVTSLIAIATVGAAGWLVSPAVRAQSTPPIVPGAMLAGIQLGGQVSDLGSRLGPVSQVRLAGPDGTLAYVFNQYGITAYVAGNVIVALTTTNSLLAGVQGIYLGAPMATVVATLGADYSPGVIEGYRAILYPLVGLGFGFDQGAVAIVMVFNPVQTPQQNPVAPPSPSVTTQIAAPAPAPALAAGVPAASGPRPGPSVPSSAVTTIPGAGGVTGLPDVRHLRPFTAETNYLSLSGYLRYVVYTMTRAWISPAESERFTAIGDTTSSP